ncbi:hypothetical protein [Puia dinghuensis]|uniref:DUF4197 domain-containing protein n=1 Tax=Puia dinghuensis TaxID=1792502 RepID=A0A8J2XWR4_9BACT|nr:hypothetical protein [Puia dinghuensis]GGB25475.1 hypothetical protein GCM10011511_56760 [Puia dinghuensis]
MEKLFLFKSKSLLLLLAVSLTFASSKAQLPSMPGAVEPKASSLLQQFAGQLKPSSFFSSWASGGKAKWLSTASKAKDAVSMAQSVSLLSTFIKPGMANQGFSLNSISQGASAVKSYSEASGLLKNLANGLKPEAFLSSWQSKKPAFMSALDMLK